jgi:hypothetical protein
MAAIHVFGDSHSRIYGSWYLRDFHCQVYYAGPLTMHRIGRDEYSLQQLHGLARKFMRAYLPTRKPAYAFLQEPAESLHISPGDYVVLVFGEIDVRAHILRQRDEKMRQLKDIIDDLVRRYANAVTEMMRANPGVSFAVQGIVPPTDEDNLQEPLKDFPMYGSVDERVQVTVALNARMKAECARIGASFIDVFPYYADDAGELELDLKDANVHIAVDHPDGLAKAMHAAGLQGNYPIRQRAGSMCKYPVHINGYTWRFYNRIRLVHRVWAIAAVVALAAPLPLVPYVFSLWTITIILNFVFSTSPTPRCFFSVIEYHVSNCNDVTMLDAMIPNRRLSRLFVLTVYVLGYAWLLIRLHRYYSR